MNRRNFIKSGLLWTPAAFDIFVPKLTAQPTLNGPEIGSFQRAAAAAAGYTYTATKFNAATPDYLSHAGNLTGVADSKLLTVSFWFKLNDAAQNATTRMFFRDDGIIQMWWEGAGDFVTTNAFGFISQDATFTNAVRFDTAATFTASSTWHHILLAFDSSNSANRAVYVDGSLDTTNWVTYANAALFWTNVGDVGIPASSAGANPTSVSLSEVWIAVGQYVDLSVSGNRDKFRSATGHPVTLGSDGSTPTGTAPTVYLKNGFATFQNNLGTGGNFTAHGSPSDDASIP